jgi:hypothetical protein
MHWAISTDSPKYCPIVDARHRATLVDCPCFPIPMLRTECHCILTSTVMMPLHPHVWTNLCSIEPLQRQDSSLSFPTSVPSGPIEPTEARSCWPKDLVGTVRTIINTKWAKLRRPEFSFELTEEAARRNFLVFKKYNLDLKAALNAMQDTPLGYGSEFRKPSVLKPPSFPNIQTDLVSNNASPSVLIGSWMNWAKNKECQT